VETLRVGAAFPDPPFNGMPEGGGFDIDLMTVIAGKLGATVELIPYQGTDFNGIFDALNSGAYDCVTAGTTVTPDVRRRRRSSRHTSSPVNRSPSRPPGCRTWSPSTTSQA
jgi:ABC-type amino acid transport substrate-binding protein